METREAVAWAALMAGRPELKDSDVAFVREQLNSWRKNAAEGFAAGVKGLPETFRTTRIGSEIKFFQAHLEALEPILNNLGAQPFSFAEALDQVARHFGGDKGRLLRWRQTQEDFRGLVQWMPDFIQAEEYLNSAFLLDEEKPDQLCKALRASLREPSRFLESKARRAFDSDFLEFKKSYAKCYSSLHDAALCVFGRSIRELMVDNTSLHNLHLLSSLQYADKTYVNRVRVMAQWAQRNECKLPVRQILENCPRCYCNFNPCNPKQRIDSAAQINALTQEGIDHFRTVFRSFGQCLMEQIQLESGDESVSKQINDLLSDAPLETLKPQLIKFLNKAILKHPREFLSALRSSPR